MSFQKKSVSFSRFYYDKPSIENMDEQVLSNLNLQKFVELPEKSPEVMAYGWVYFKNMLATEFDTAPLHDEYYIFALRIDKKRVAPSVFKKCYAEALEKEMEIMQDLGKNYITKDRKKEIKEQVMLKLRMQSVAVPASFEVIWDKQERVIYFQCTNSKITDLFMELFERSFSIELKKMLPTTLACNMGAISSEEISALEYISFINKRRNDLIADKDLILGSDFLTWLWCKSEINNKFPGKDGKRVTVWFQNKILVQHGAIKASVSGADTPMNEARQGLFEHKKVKSCELVFLDDDAQQFEMNVCADTFVFSAFKTPNVGDNIDFVNDERANFLLKIDFIKTGLRYFDMAYMVFLGLRFIEKAWDMEIDKIREWISQGLNKELL